MPYYDTLDVAVLSDNDSVVLGGQTFGDWSGERHGGRDFAAVKLGNNLTEIWRWQVGDTVYYYIVIAAGTFNMPASYQTWVWEREAHIN